MKTFKSVSKYIALVAICFLTACFPNKPQTLTILHTNDTHSQVEPLEIGKRDATCGGYARRMGLIHQERKEDPQLLLFDAGDFSQGTPYFNFYHGRIEVEAYGNTKDDAKAIDFDDSFIYDQLDLSYADRSIKCEHFMRDNALAAFRKWDEKEDKVRY